MELIFDLWRFFIDFSNFVWDVLTILFGVLLLISKKVREASRGLWTAVGEELADYTHIHIYRDKEGWVSYDAGGLTIFRRERKCRCGAIKTTIKGEF